jgi:hypothetical protein
MEYEGIGFCDYHTYDGPDLRRRHYASWKDREKALAAGRGNGPCKGAKARRERQRREAMKGRKR